MYRGLTDLWVCKLHRMMQISLVEVISHWNHTVMNVVPIFYRNIQAEECLKAAFALNNKKKNAGLILESSLFRLVAIL